MRPFTHLNASARYSPSTPTYERILLKLKFKIVQLLYVYMLHRKQDNSLRGQTILSAPARHYLNLKQFHTVAVVHVWCILFNKVGVR
jgi:hypothetical protein